MLEAGDGSMRALSHNAFIGAITTQAQFKLKSACCSHGRRSQRTLQLHAVGFFVGFLGSDEKNFLLIQALAVGLDIQVQNIE